MPVSTFAPETKSGADNFAYQQCCCRLGQAIPSNEVIPQHHPHIVSVGVFVSYGVLLGSRMVRPKTGSAYVDSVHADGWFGQFHLDIRLSKNCNFGPRPESIRKAELQKLWLHTTETCSHANIIIIIYNYL